MRRILPTLLFLGLLLIVALRLTMTESLDSSSHGTQVVAAAGQPELPQPGPAVTVGCFVLTLAIAGGACLIAPLRRIHFLVLGLIVAILVWAGFSAVQAEAPFVALTGACDLAAGLLGGLGALLLCNHISCRQLLLCTLAAVLAAGVAKGINQRFVEIPDTIRYYQENKADIWAANGWKAGDPSITLFEGRMNSRELTGYLTLSNIFAASLIPLVLGTVAVALESVLSQYPARRKGGDPVSEGAGMSSRRTSAEAVRSGRKEKPKLQEPPAPDPSIQYALAVLLFLVAATGAWVLLTTGSRGAVAAGLGALGFFVAGYFGRAFLVVHRRRLTWAGLALLLLASGAVVGYGLSHHGLPSRSLLFRWQYWSGAFPIIREHPLLGVGLNNFGSYYSQHKWPSAPEDVKDPHNTFVRLAAESGLPAMGLFALLMFLLVLRPLLIPVEGLPSSGVRSPRFRDAATPVGLPFRAAAMFGAVLCVVWWSLHRILAEPAESYFAMFCILLAMVALAAFLPAAALLAALPVGAARRAVFAAFVGALAVLLYDQISTALVTGPVAMLFWVILGAVNAPEETAPENGIAPDHASSKEAAAGGGPRAQPPGGRLVHHLLGGVLLLAAAGCAIAVWLPIARGTWPTDPAPFERAALDAWNAQNYPAALQAIDDALIRNPRSAGLLRKRIGLLERLHRPVGTDIEHLLALRPADAPLHLELAAMESDLSPARRVAILQKALWLNDQLTADEPRRFSPQDLTRLQTLLARLQPTASSPAP